MLRPLLAISLLLVACGAESVDVGSTHPEEAGGTDSASPPPPGPPLPTWPDPTSCVASSNSDLVGVWTGAFEGNDFRPIMSLRVEFLGASEAGGLCGTLVIGDGEPPPPPTDPTAAYPPLPPGGYFVGGLYDGATYTLGDGGMLGDSLYFEVDSSELLKDWCALQTPVYVASQKAWQCLPGVGGYTVSGDECQMLNEQTGATEMFPLAQCKTCLGGLDDCVCNESGCTSSPNGEHSQRTEFKLQRSGDQLLGTINLEKLNVALQRAN